MSDPRLTETLDLVFAAQRGDREATEELFLRYYPVAVRVAELRLGERIRGRQEAEDIAQEALLGAFCSLTDFAPHSNASFRNWLSQIVENRIRDASKRAWALKRGAGRVCLHSELGETSLADSIFGGGGPTPSQIVMGEELEARIEEMLLGRLNENEREVVLLRDLCRMSFAEVAVEMGYEESSARSLHSRTIRRLEGWFQELS